jgi:beta-N-acetylhexosaminidase
MLLIGFDGKKVNQSSPIVKTIEKNNIGGVILFDYDSHKDIFDRNIESPAQVKKLNHDLQYFNYAANVKKQRRQLPLLISIDYEGGNISRLAEEYGFPKTLSAAEVGKKRLEEATVQAQIMAKTLKDAGFNLDFAPVLDVNVNPENPVIAKEERSFSNDPNKVAEFARIYSKAFLDQKVQCAYKHFPGHGSSSNDSHLGFVDVTETWKAYELKPHQAMINSNKTCGVMMTAHIVNKQLDKSGLPATLSHAVLTDLLRNQLHYQGLIITDDMQMKAISAHYGLAEALVLAINAGADMMIFGNNLTVKAQDPEEVINIIEAKVLSGDISLERIDDAYRRIIALKQTIK